MHLYGGRLGGNLLIAVPMGEFARYADPGGGFGVFGVRYFGETRSFGVRVDMNLVSYGKVSESHPLDLGGVNIDLDLKTENLIGSLAVGPQYVHGKGTVRPYVGASVGSAQFITTTSVWAGRQSVPIAAAKVLEHHTLSLSGGGGVRLALLSRGTRPIALEIDGRYLWHSPVEYLREGSVHVLSDGSVALEPVVSGVNLWRFHFGAVIGFRSSPQVTEQGIEAPSGSE